MSSDNPFVIDLPILSDEAVDAVHTLLLDIARRFEDQYFSQLHRYHHALEEQRRQHQPSPFDRPSDDDKRL